MSDDPDEPEIVIEMTADVMSVEGEDNFPAIFELFTPFPNPFNSSTTISYLLPVRSYITLQIYNTRGQLVDAQMDREMPAERHEVVWDANEMAAGMYLIVLQVNSVHKKYFRKLILMK